MQYKKLTLYVVLLIGLELTGVLAQEAIPASGGEASGSGGSSNYSVGQVFYTTNTGTNCSIIQGVQQPYEIFVVTGFKETKGINLEWMIYPNPTTDILMLRVNNYNKKNLSYQLFDMNGKLIENKKLTSNEITISMAKFVSATYVLKVIANQKEFKTFKITKN